MKAKLLSLGVLLAAFAGGCGEQGHEAEEGDGATPPTAASEPDAPAGEVKFEAVGGDPDSGEPHGEAGYAEKTEDGTFIKEFEVEVLGAAPGKRLVVTIDGVEVGTMTTDLDGEGDLELLEADDVFFPEGFPEVKAGSVVAVADVISFTLSEVERLVSLHAGIDSDGMVGTAKFQIEKMGDRVVKEFKLQIEGAESGAVYPIALDGQALGDLGMDVEGAAKMKLGYGEDPFPEGFKDPKSGATLTIGDVAEVTLK